MSLKLSKQALPKATMKLEIENEDGSQTVYSWLINRIGNTESLRLSAGGEADYPTKLLNLIETSEPINNSPKLIDILDMTDTAGLEELTEAIFTAASSSTVEDSQDGSREA